MAKSKVRANTARPGAKGHSKAKKARPAIHQKTTRRSKQAAVLALLSRPSGFFLIGIDASFGTRLARLGVRTVRPMTEPQLRERDAMDLTRLKTGNVLAKAGIRIDNEGSMTEFEDALSRALDSCL